MSAERQPATRQTESDFAEVLDASNVSLVPHESAATSRVAQLDALDMEEEIYAELLQTVGRIARPVAPALLQRFRPELQFALRALFFRYTVAVNKPSVGCQLQGLVFANGSIGAAAEAAAEAALEAAKNALRAADGVGSSSSATKTETRLLEEEIGVGTLTQRQKFLYFLFGIGGPWAVSRFKDLAMRYEWHLAEAGTLKYYVWTTFEKVESAWRLLSVLHFAVFLYRGTYRSIVERVLRMRLVPAAKLAAGAATNAGAGAGQRLLDFEETNQELIWSTLGHFILVARHFVPWTALSAVARALGSATAALHAVLARLVLRPMLTYLVPQFLRSRVSDALGVKLLPSDDGDTEVAAPGNRQGNLSRGDALRKELCHPCQICGDALVMPYVSNCGHCFCYMCLHQACNNTPASYRCPRCEGLVLSSQRVLAEMLQDVAS